MAATGNHAQQQAEKHKGKFMKIRFYILINFAMVSQPGSVELRGRRTGFTFSVWMFIHPSLTVLFVRDIILLWITSVVGSQTHQNVKVIETLIVSC